MNMEQYMKKIIVTALIGFSLIFSGCSDIDDNKIIFATSAEYPPFEYMVKGEMVGFDVELGYAIAEELGKKAEFKNIQFGSILPALQTGIADAAIATITITKEREKNFDFSTPYYMESLAAVFPKDKPIKKASALNGKKIACQLGTTMEFWLKNNATDTKITTVDTNPQAIEVLKAGHVDGVLIDSVQAKSFSEKNKGLSYKVVIQSNVGYGVAFKKGSPLKDKVNKAIKSLEKKGVIKKLKDKYGLEGIS